MEKILKEVELIRGENNSNALFHIDTNSIFRINDFTFDLLNNIKEGKTVNYENTEINPELIEQFLNKIKSATDNKEKITRRPESKTIDRITLMISNDCNLECTYCYGDGGSYKKKKNLMSEETAKYIVDFFVKNKYTINSIVFFGGEPMLNIPVMEFICGYYDKLKTKKVIEKKPDFGMITNGTIVNKRIIKLIDKYEIGVTVSIDGPKDINDKNRVFKNGKGSFDLIKNFIETIQKETNNKTIMAECTFTEEHKKMGYNDKKLTQFFSDELKINSIVVPELSLEKKDMAVKKDYSGIINFFKTALDEKTPVNNDVLNSLYYLTHTEQCENCRIGEKMLAISSEGEIFPCHMNASAEKTSLGNIFRENIFNEPEKLMKKNSYLRVVQKLEGECGKCWARNLCQGCSVKKFFDEEKQEYTSKPNKDMCERTKEYYSVIISNVSKIQSKPDVWPEFVKKINEVELPEQVCV